MPVQIRPGVPSSYAPHAEAVEATACKPVLTRCESGAALHFILSPRDVTDSMRGFEPRRQGATPSAETIPRVAQQKRHPAQTRISARANRAAGTISKIPASVEVAQQVLALLGVGQYHGWEPFRTSFQGIV